ncbi:MAG: hypothetical protein DDT32_02330 [Syntrophomonadaceae bacterium]|nr:hypothetical protein [Bacillota bacterium]
MRTGKERKSKMPAPIIAGALAGGIIGYIVGKDQQVQPIYAPKPGGEAMQALPEPHTHLSRKVIGVGETLVTAAEWQVTGNTIIVEGMTLTGRLFVRFNDLNSETIALHQVNKIVFTVPFWRLFFDAPVQPVGAFTIVVGTGLELHERPLKAEMAELAARLGSINTFDRRGDVIWMDEFGDNINKWLIDRWGVGSSATLSTETALCGSRSAKLSTGSVSGNFSRIVRYQHIPLDTPIGFEVSFAGIPWGGEHRFDPSINTGTHFVITAVRFIASTGTLSVWIRPHTWLTLVSGLTILDHLQAFSTIKVIYNIPARRYHRVYFNNLAFDVSAHSFNEDVDTHMPCIIPSIQFTTRTAVSLATYIDNVIITRNEPL